MKVEFFREVEIESINSSQKLISEEKQNSPPTFNYYLITIYRSSFIPKNEKKVHSFEFMPSGSSESVVTCNKENG